MNKTEILMQYEGQVNEIYRNNIKAIAHLEVETLFNKYVSQFKIMMQGGTMTYEEYDELTTEMLITNMMRVED